MRRGSMLVVAMWALSMLGVFAISLNFGVRQKAAMLSRLSTLDALYPIAYSGVERAKSLVRADSNFDVDTLNDVWAKPAEDGVSVVDEERKVNLNRTSAEIAVRLFHRVSGLSRDRAEELVYNLLDWMDSDSNFGHPNYGAEDSYYEGLRKPYSAKDAPYESIDELLLVKNMTPEVFARIRPYVTVYGSGQINVNTAGVDVLGALGFSTDAIATILKYRSGPDGEAGTSDDIFFTNVSTIVTTLSDNNTPLGVDQAVLLDGLITTARIGVSSSAFTASTRATLEERGASLEVEAVFNRRSDVLYHRTGEVQWQRP